jgi:hypothetical protein
MSTNPQEPGNEPSFVNENSLRIASESLTHYDENADTYHCSYGPPVPAITIHDPERNMLVRIDPTSHQVIGFTIPNFRAWYAAHADPDGGFDVELPSVWTDEDAEDGDR